MAISALASAGAVDAAFAEARAALARGERLNPQILFGAATRSMRRDARFMPLANDLGLVAYWRATNHWPDFCAEPDLPYDCKAFVPGPATGRAAASPAKSMAR